MLEATLTFYGIEKCGYYRPGNQCAQFGNIAGTLGELKSWALDSNKALAETCTFKPSDETDHLGVFCFDMATNPSGDFLVVTWNETETLGEAMASVNGTQPVGKAQVITNDLPKNHIAGFPTYFWFIPDKKVFASIKIGNRLIGRNGLQALVQGFLQHCSKHAVYAPTQPNCEAQLMGYRSKSADEPSFEVRPRFVTYREKTPGHLQFITDNRTSISKVIKKTILNTAIEDDHQFLKRLLAKFGYTQTTEGREQLKITAELPAVPNERELASIIKTWEDEVGSTNPLKWSDVGFRMHGNQKIHWLSRGYVVETVTLELGPRDAGIYSASDMLARLAEMRDSLLASTPL